MKRFILVKAVMDLKSWVKTPSWLKPARCIVNILNILALNLLAQPLFLNR